MKKILILLATLLVTTTTSAGLWPVITSIRPEFIGMSMGGGAYVYNYYITQTLLEVGPSVDVVMPNDYIHLTHRHNPHQDDVGGTPTASTKTSSTQTISQTAVDFYNNTGSRYTFVQHTGDQPTDECVAYIVSTFQDPSYAPWSQAFVPGGCLVVPPADEWCKITTPELVLDHGVITLKQAESSTAKTQMGVMCTTTTAVQFNMITGDDYVYLDEGKSQISVNDLPLKTKIDLPQGNSSLPVKDLLTGITKEGFHTGSGVLVMMPY
ncbi:hypothetical protein E0D81_19400 [Lelliottia amnigena]|uniref:Adhesin n=1 Tax=Lelliottia amnigena TaxID=61646 RepID=A0AAP2F0L4_LELAM|nr:hypothetical protein [Lelliottia amnigena]MBL5898805.1 hypothetical protein [Lelliottia amnigena]MBL5934454.1 hypothetical protein [Lelliottia amnigena]TCD14823.1 hypothetical protein E0D81_19400 [Lelliottia amnigena]